MRAARRALAEVDMGTDDLNINLGPALRTFVRKTVREELNAAGEADPWIPHPRWPCASRRAACALARSGALEGVRRTGEGRGALYVVRRSVLDAWIEAHPLDAAREPGADDYEQEMTKRNLRPGLAPAKPAARSRDDDEGDR
jgi:hypothetical protein